MRGHFATALLLAAAATPACGEGPAPREALAWSELPPLPPAPGQSAQIGLAGPYVGMHRGALIVAGGANFPDALPWRGGRKVWWDDVYVLPGARGAPAIQALWRTHGSYRLPRPLAYGASVSTDRGVVCIGGCDANQCYAGVFRLRWEPDRQRVLAEDLPALPRPLAFLGAGRIGSTVYVCGGQETMADARATAAFWALDLAQEGNRERFIWKELPPWPGPARVLPVVAPQSDGDAECLYIFSGRDVAPGRPTNCLTDAWRYHPKTGTWKELAPPAPKGEPPRCLMAAPALASGAHHVLVFGGADAGLFELLEGLDRRAAQAADEAEKAKWVAQSRRVLESHPGFSRDVLAYHTITDTWAKVGELPAGAPVTTTAAGWDGSFFLPTGEVRPGVRTPKVRRGDVLPPSARAFGRLDYRVLAIYLAVLVAMGVYFSRRERSTDDFFRAGRRVPWWAAGLSIFGTQLSAITFMAIPAKTYATDWRMLAFNLCILAVAPVIVAVFLPFFRRLDVTTAYEYLERRFNLAARLVGSVMFIILQFGRIGIVLFLPSIALSVVTGIDVRVCILVMGVLSIAYTVLGGIEAVIWTDVLQVVVLLGGAVLSLALIATDVEGGLAGLVDLAARAGKFRAFDFRFDLAGPTFWVVAAGGLAASFISYGTDQAVIQRYLTTKDERAAARGIWTNALLSVPATLIFFGLGTALFAFYRTNPDLANPTLDNADAIFPWYIVTQLPPGVAGLLIAGIFAAAMSSLDSSMNSVATAVTTDFFRRFRPAAPDRTCLNVARWATAAIGLAGTAFALMMTGWNIQSLWDQLNKVIGLFTGGLGGLFLLGIFSRRAHGRGAVTGLLLSGAVPFLLQRYTQVSFLLFAAAGMVGSIVLGYAASWVIPIRAKPLDGLTFATLARRGD